MITKTYAISGMTCDGCRSKVERLLNEIPEVRAAAVDLKKAQAQIKMEEVVSEAQFQQVLTSKYAIVEKDPTSVLPDSNTSPALSQKSKIEQLQPLFLIFAYLIVTSVLLNYKNWNFEAAMLDFMGLFYVVFSFFKLLDLKGFPNSFRMYDPLAKVLPFYAWIYPFLEVALGLMFLLRFEITIALIATVVILGVTTIGVTKTLMDKKSIRCACLGTALKLPMTEATFIENTVMIAMAVVMLLKGM